MMKLSRQSEIAIAILAASAETPGNQLQTRQLASIACTTKDHAARVVGLLVRKGYLASVRGRKGGVQLAANPAGITLGELLRLTEPDLGEVARFSQEIQTSRKALDIVVDAAFASFERIQCVDCWLVNASYRRPSLLTAKDAAHA